MLMMRPVWSLAELLMLIMGLRKAADAHDASPVGA